MSMTLQGTGVARGIAIGYVHVLHRGHIDIPEYSVEKKLVDAEIKRLEDAVIQAKQQLREIKKHIPENTSVDIVGIYRHTPVNAGRPSARPRTRKTD